MAVKARRVARVLEIVAATNSAFRYRPAPARRRPAGPLDALETLRPAPAELIISTIALMIATIGYAYGDLIVETTNLIVPTLLIAGLGIGCLKMARRDIACIWAPVFWNRVVLIAYFGVGSIVPLFVNDETRETMSVLLAALDDCLA